MLRIHLHATLGHLSSVPLEGIRLYDNRLHAVVCPERSTGAPCRIWSAPARISATCSRFSIQLARGQIRCFTTINRWLAPESRRLTTKPAGCP